MPLFGKKSSPSSNLVIVETGGRFAKDLHIVYSPFPKPAKKGVRALGTSWEKHSSKFLVVRHGDFQQALGFVKDGQTVYIVCHCSPMSDHVSDNEGNQLSAAQLALRMRLDGLSPGIKRLKLYACSGASGGVYSFASQLGLELKHAGFHSFTLYAYHTTLYSLNDVTGKKTANALDAFGNEDPTQQVPASSVRTVAWYQHK